MYNLIACVNKQGLLGHENDLYSTSGKDLMNFSSVTKGHNTKGHNTKGHNTKGHNTYKQNVIVMGYNTWLSLPSRPLPNRHNIILSRKHLDRIDIGHTTMSSLKITFQYLEENKDRFGEVFVIGGASIYEQCLLEYPEQLNKLYITEVDDTWSGNDDSKYFHYGSVLSRLCLLRDTNEVCPTRIYDPNVGDHVIKDLKLSFKIFQKRELINYNELHYLRTMKTIMDTGNTVEGRNGLTKSSFGEKMIFNLDKFPLLTTKKMGHKTILRELLWFLKGSTDNQELLDKKVSIWSGNASKEFLESRGLDYEEGDLGPIYGFQWRHFGAEYNGREADYTGCGFDQIKWLVQEIKENPSSRRLILSAWNAADIDKMALPPCHVLSQFYVDVKEGIMSCQLYQRSGDMFLGVPFNIASYAFLTYILCKLTGYKPGKLHHVIGDAHVYEEHFQAVKEQYKRIPKQFPKLIVSDDLQDIDDIREEMFRLEDYEYYSPINAPMKV